MAAESGTTHNAIDILMNLLIEIKNEDLNARLPTKKNYFVFNMREYEKKKMNKCSIDTDAL